MTQSTELQPESRVGEIIDGRYRIIEHVASGGMACVYRAQHLHNAGVVAIKILNPELATNSEVSARFRREALAARSIRHPNVVSVWDVGRLPDGCCFMVLEFIPGEDLCAALHRQKPFDQVRAVKIALQVVHALVSAHAAGIVHRDLKPDNIMLIERGGDPDFVKVVDFGIAKVKTQGAALLTAIGSVFGTPEYMAPEQARGASVDHRTDLYTLGTVLFEMLTGSAPFAHENFAQVLMAQISQPPPPLPREVDPELAGLVIKLLAKDPAQRVQTATELRARLSAILQRLAPGHPLLASMPPETPISAAALPVVAGENAPTVAARQAFAPKAFAPDAVAPLPPMRPPPSPQFGPGTAAARSAARGRKCIESTKNVEPAKGIEAGSTDAYAKAPPVDAGGFRGDAGELPADGHALPIGKKNVMLGWVFAAAIALGLMYLVAHLVSTMQ